jgi:hypothetical protein
MLGMNRELHPNGAVVVRKFLSKLRIFQSVHQSEVSVMSKENYCEPPLRVYRDAASNLHSTA